MFSRLSSIFTRFFWPLLLILLAASLTLVLWTGRPENAKYAEMACTFENRDPACIDSVRDWREGLAFYDSSLTVTRDPLASLKLLLWDYWNIEFAGAGEAAVSAEAILPLRVLETRKSGCMGLSWLAMMVAEARGIPLEVILLPGHVYLRYGKDDGRAQAGFAPKTVNLEPNRRGYSYTDEEYRHKYREGHWTGLEFKPLTPAQFMGLAAFDIGNLYLEADVSRSLRWYRLAEDLFPEYPGIRVNQEIAKNRLPDRM
ncbi:MAG: hypothetical protein IKZ45_10160 [Fibrobacter sp.]|nr:hypothetical protein [Fibrobacter sp.]MBR4917413.1 hypothetical protein [Fibrobacter sp.]